MQNGKRKWKLCRRAMVAAIGAGTVFQVSSCNIDDVGVISASADTGAFYGGRALGRHPLAPLLSPNKTIEGLATGVLCGMGAALVARAWFIHRLDLVDCVVLGILLAVIGAVGDLVESMIKRWAGAKNSSELIPGHGGILLFNIVGQPIWSAIASAYTDSGDPGQKIRSDRGPSLPKCRLSGV